MTEPSRHVPAPPDPLLAGAEPDAERVRELKGKVRRFALIAAVVALVLAAWGVTSRIHARSQLRKTSAENALITVATAKPTLGGADAELVLPGIVQAYIESPIYARTNGYLKSWRTDIGAHVHRGELLAEIDTPEVDRQLSQARADLATAQANLDLAVLTNQRWQGLLKTQSVSQQDADNKAGDAAAKLATVDSARQNVKRLEDLESFKRVLAPFDGVVTARNTDIGYLINAGQTPGSELFRMSDLHRLRIYAQVPEAYAGAATTGLKGELYFMERPGQVFYADAVRTSRALDPSARTLQVELDLDNDKADLLPGSYADIHFKLPESSATLRLPANTILFRNTGLQVATVQHGDTIQLKYVIQGRDFGKTIEILSGLDPNDEVVVNPPDSIADGARVRIAPPPPRGSSPSPAPGTKPS
ncbi:MAG TPA: efflux RND transporter periplasmic adaptor subunit [Steroidobacteraceae bacterium]|nr:efflux RND transporter periplasmic adaptor subunit [Steroidobacteraceae bacterium]